MKKVLVIEDNEMTVEIYKLIFGKYIPEVEVEYIDNGEEAVERVTKNGFDLLIADYNLGHPEINGMDIARLTYPLGKPIIIVSGHKFIPKLTLVLRYWDMINKVSFINKPFKIKNLISHIQKQLNRPTTSLTDMFDIITNSL